LEKKSIKVPFTSCFTHLPLFTPNISFGLPCSGHKLDGKSHEKKNHKVLRVPPKVGDDLEPEIRHLRYLSQTVSPEKNPRD
jgi:hypothetical protein